MKPSLSEYISRPPDIPGDMETSFQEMDDAIIEAEDPNLDNQKLPSMTRTFIRERTKTNVFASKSKISLPNIHVSPADSKKKNATDDFSDDDHRFSSNFQPMFKYQINPFSQNAGDFRPYFIGNKNNRLPKFA